MESLKSQVISSGHPSKTTSKTLCQKNPSKQTTTNNQNNGQGPAKNNKSKPQKRRSTKTQKHKQCFCPKAKQAAINYANESPMRSTPQKNRSILQLDASLKKKMQKTPFIVLHQASHQQYHFASLRQLSAMCSLSPRRRARQSHRKHETSPPQNPQNGFTEF